MKFIEKILEKNVIELSQKEAQLITSALAEMSNVLDVDDCETRTGFKLEGFDKLFYEFNILDDR